MRSRRFTAAVGLSATARQRGGNGREAETMMRTTRLRVARCIATCVLGGWCVVAALAADPVETGGSARSQRVLTTTAGVSDAVASPALPAREPRLYVAGMLASSGQMRGSGDLTIPGPVPAAVGLTGGGAGGEAAFGLAVPRPAGWLRLELEAGGRPTGGTSATTETGQQWSSLVNAWRDVDVTERVGLYAGGGIGVGRSATADDLVPPGGVERAAAAVAWQAGAGLTYAATDRVTIDLGYRQRGMAAGDAGLGAGEALLAVRIYDPFRGWLK
jgi:opacity protein-like surface antigen